jgi:hypothetical protein
VGEIDQYDLFLPIPDEIEYVKSDVKEIKQSLDRQRKSQFAKIGDIKKMQLELMDRLEILERNICRGKDAGS